MILRDKIQTNEDQRVYFASDYHFWHKNVIRFDGRPYDSVVDMNEDVILKWNNKVNENDLVYYLGDMAFAGQERTTELVWRLNGKITFILGNHDRLRIINRTKRFEGIYDYGELWVQQEGNETIDGKPLTQHICMSHYPMMVWNKHHRGSWMLHGHCHNNLRGNAVEFYQRKIEDMGLNHWNYEPASFEEVKAVMDKKVISSIDHHGTED